MNGWNSWGIRRKLFSIVLAILVLHMVLLLFMGSTLFEWFYTSSKAANLKEAAKKIAQAYQEDGEAFYQEISSIEDENALVSVVRMTGDTQDEKTDEEKAVPMTVSYYSRMSVIHTDEPPKALPPEVEREFQRRESERMQQVYAQIRQAGEVPLVQVVQDPHGGPDASWNEKLSVTMQLDESTYLYIQTPRDYIKSTADLAVRYTALLSLGILLVGSVGIYFAVSRMAKPFQEIQTVADKIARMDFSEKCSVKGRDEIGKLAASINHMSDELQDNIQTLVAANEVLQSDLVRQQQTDRMRRQFVANVSHDFKTPLTLMITHAEALSEGCEGTEREYCETIIQEGGRLSLMVNRLLELSKLESGADRVEESIFCLGEVLDDAVRAHSLLTKRRGISVSRTLEDEFIVRADYQKIVRVVSNLFENAAKYAPDNGWIAVRAKRDGERCRVEIENAGEPIGEDDLESLFDSFYRADKSRSRADGYGLGLAIVKRLMEAHGQPVGAENIEGGVRFWFALPLVEMDDDPEETP